MPTILWPHLRHNHFTVGSGTGFDASCPTIALYISICLLASTAFCFKASTACINKSSALGASGPSHLPQAICPVRIEPSQCISLPQVSHFIFRSSRCYAAACSLRIQYHGSAFSAHPYLSLLVAHANLSSPCANSIQGRGCSSVPGNLSRVAVHNKHWPVSSCM